MEVIPVLMFLVFCIIGSIVAQECPERDESLTICERSCAEDRSCKKSNKVCECDDQCGWSCLRIGCTSVNAPVNGHVSIVPSNRSIGAIATFTCSYGYVLQGDSVISCDSSKTWNASTDASCVCTRNSAEVTIQNRRCLRVCSSDADCLRERKCVCDDICGPSCISTGRETYCPIPSPNINNANYSIDLPSPKFGAIARITCVDGYISDDEYIERRCLGNYEWSDKPISCLPEKYCNTSMIPVIELAEPQNADKSYYLPSERISYSCDPGYYRDSRTTYSIICQENNTWTEISLNCLPKSCGPPISVDNGQTDGTVYTFLSSVEYKCDLGYTLVGLSTRHCQTTQEWSGSVPQCVPVVCSAPNIPQNGRKIGTDYGYDEDVTFTCEEGFSLYGSSTITCKNTGQWSDSVPMCTPFCTLPTDYGTVRWSITDGCQAGQLQPNGCSLTYTCTAGYSPESSDVVSVCTGGTWDNYSTPECWKECDMVNVPNGTVSYELNGGVSARPANGSMLKIVCDTKYFLNDTVDEVYCNNGTWTSDIAMCKPLFCDTSDLPDKFIQVQKFNNGILKVRCPENFCLVNSKYLRCVKGQWYKAHQRMECKNMTGV